MLLIKNKNNVTNNFIIKLYAVDKIDFDLFQKFTVYLFGLTKSNKKVHEYIYFT